MVKHRQIAGSLLIIFAVVNIVVAGIMITRILDLSHSNQEPVFIIFTRVMIGAVVATILLLLLQVLAGYKMLRNGPGAYGWGIAGSVIAIVCGISLPAGVYSLWVNLKSKGN